MLVAKEAGVNFFDNAESYSRGNGERVMGNVLKKSGWRRSELVISTKIFFGSEGNRGPNDTGLSRSSPCTFLPSLVSSLSCLDATLCTETDTVYPIQKTYYRRNE
jgi:aryl-alcohol dehydrogenase-like predicted oxidoreductase